MLINDANLSRTDKAYSILKTEIMENRMPPGYQAVETELAARLGISRTPVREAIVRLSEEGLVEIRRRHGMRVLPISVDAMKEIYGLLSILMPECARQIVSNGLSRSQIDEIEELTDKMDTAMVDNDLDAWARAEDQFHRIQIQFLSNFRLAKMINQLLDQTHRARILTLNLNKKNERTSSDHRAMIDAMRQGDVARLFVLHTVFWERAGEALINSLELHNLHYI